MKYPRYPKYKDSGVEWLGEVPEGWGIRKFRYTFSESSEKIFDTVIGPMLSVSGYRGIEIKEYDDDNRRRLDDDLVGYRIVRQGQLVVNTMWLNYAGLGVSVYEGHVSPAYRSYWIDTSLFKPFINYMMRSYSFVCGYTKFLAGIRPNSLQMSREDLMSFLLLSPPYIEQQTIAAFLDHHCSKIDALIAEQEKLITLLREKRQAVISHAVTKGLNPDAPMKDSGVEWLGEVPEGWEIIPFKLLIARIASGTSVNAVDNPASEQEFGVLKTSCVYLGYFDAKENKAVLPEEYDRLSCPVKKGALIVSRMNTPELVGAAGVADSDYPNIFLPDRLWSLFLKQHYSANFIHYWTSTNAYRGQVKMACAGTSSSMQNLSQDKFKDFILACPPLSDQYAILTYLDAETAKIDALIAESEKAVALLKERRVSLISAAVTGTIDVRDIPLQEAV